MMSDAQHTLIVTAEPLSDDDLATMTTRDKAAYLADPDLSYDVECSGVSPSCESWFECGCSTLDYQAEADDRDEDPEDTALMLPCKKNGKDHQLFSFGLATPSGTCFVASNDHLPDAASDATSKPGRYLVDFDVPDETDLVLTIVETL